MYPPLLWEYLGSVFAFRPNDLSLHGQQAVFTASQKELWCLEPLETEWATEFLHVSMPPCHCCKYPSWRIGFKVSPLPLPFPFPSPFLLLLLYYSRS